MKISKEVWFKIYKETIPLRPKHLWVARDGMTGEYILLAKTRKGREFLEKIKKLREI